MCLITGVSGTTITYGYFSLHSCDEDYCANNIRASFFKNVMAN